MPAFRPALRASLLLKQTAFVALVTIVTGGTVILAASTFARRLLRDEIDQRLVLVATDRQVLLQTYIQQQLERAALVTSRTRLRQLVEDHAAGRIPGDEFRRQSTLILADAQRSAAGFLSISLADPQGRVITGTDPTELGKNHGADPDFLAGRPGGHLGIPRHEGEALLTAPLVSNAGQLLAVALIFLDIQPLDNLLASRTGLGQSGEVQLGTVQGDGIRLLQTSTRALQLADLPRGGAPLMEPAIRGETGLVRARDYRGVEVLAAYRPVGYRDWGLVVKLDVTEAYAPLTRFHTVIILLEAAIVLTGIALSYLLARRFTRPILELAGKAAAISAGNLTVRTDLAQRTDELGELARAFDEMAERIAQHVRQTEEARDGLERRVADRTAQLEAANKELEAFSYSVAHDLRAPLRAMDGFSKLVMEDFAPHVPGDGQRYLQMIRDNAQQMGRLIDDLLAFSRLGRHPLNRQRVQTTRLVEQIVQDLQREQEGRRVTIVVGALPDCDADPALLKQIFVNLLSNALKFTRGRDEVQVEVNSRADGDGTVYYVKDNGTGFDMRYAGKLFGVFQRLHRAEEYEGTGVGLAIVQRIVHRHGGRVWTEAAVGQGATFFFTLGGTTDGGDTGRNPAG